MLSRSPCSTPPEFVFCYLAAHKIGAVACPVNYRQGAGEIALVIDDSTPKAFIYDAEFGELSGGALDLCESKPAIKIVVGADDAVPAGQVRYADYAADQPENDPPIDFDPHIYDETTRLYTSGNKPTVRRACRSTISTRCFPRMTL